MFDLVAFIKDRGIDYVESGANVSRGNINIHCPFCGAADPSHHMGISMQTGHWGCRRSQYHRGKKPGRLIHELLQCTWAEVERILGAEVIPLSQSVDELLNIAKGIGGSKAPTGTLRQMTFPECFTTIKNEWPTKRYAEYLMRRGFPEDLGERYGLQAALGGEWQNRVILPIIEDYMIGWTGRAIGPSEIRYRAHPTGPAAKQTLFNYSQAATGGETLVIVEGPLDALRVDCVSTGRWHAVGLMSTAATGRQMVQLSRLSLRYDSLLVLLDADAQTQAMQMQASLAFCGARLGRLPVGVKDPGELPLAAIAGTVIPRRGI